MVPDVPDDPVEANRGDLVAVAVDFVVDVSLEPSLVSIRHRIALHEALCQPDSAQLEAARQSIDVAVPWVISTLPPPMSITTARPLPTSTP